MPALFRHADGVLPNTLALSFTLLGWPAGFALLGQDAWWLNAAGVLLVMQGGLMGVFLLVLVVGFIYEWKKGALEWD